VCQHILQLCGIQDTAPIAVTRVCLQYLNGLKTSACTVKTLQLMAASTVGVLQIAQVPGSYIMHHHSELRPIVADKRRLLKTCALSSELMVRCTVEDIMPSLVLIILCLNSSNVQIWTAVYIYRPYSAGRKQRHGCILIQAF